MKNRFKIRIRLLGKETRGECRGRGAPSNFRRHTVGGKPNQNPGANRPNIERNDATTGNLKEPLQQMYSQLTHAAPDGPGRSSKKKQRPPVSR